MCARNIIIIIVCVCASRCTRLWQVVGYLVDVSNRKRLFLYVMVTGNVVIGECPRLLHAVAQRTAASRITYAVMSGGVGGAALLLDRPGKGYRPIGHWFAVCVCPFSLPRQVTGLWGLLLGGVGAPWQRPSVQWHPSYDGSVGVPGRCWQGWGRSLTPGVWHSEVLNPTADWL
jgi:hypothetical protein